MDYGELDSEMQKTLEKHLDLLVVTGVLSHLGVGGGDVNFPCTCAHGRCYAIDAVGEGGMLTFLALVPTVEATPLMRIEVLLGQNKDTPEITRRPVRQRTW